jgi:hypothetical protein
MDRAGSAGVADAFGEGPGALAANFDETFIAGDLIESGKGPLRFGQKFVVEVCFELQKRVVDAKTIVFHATLEQSDEFLLAGESFKNLHELHGRRVEGVVELGFVAFRTFFPPKSLFPKISDAPVDVEVDSLEILELRGEPEHFLAQSAADFEGRSAGIFFKLADFERSGVGVLVDDDLDEFRRAGFEDPTVAQLGVAGWGRWCRRGGMGRGSDGRAVGSGHRQDQQDCSEGTGIHAVLRMREKSGEVALREQKRHAPRRFLQSA